MTAENFPKPAIDTKAQIREADETPEKINRKKNKTPKRIVFKLWKAKGKEKILKESGGTKSSPTGE